MPRKTAARIAQQAAGAAASMRPRPDAAENSSPQAKVSTVARRFNEAAARCRGKQRDVQHEDVVVRASMRPRPDAAENARLDAEVCKWL